MVVYDIVAVAATTSGGTSRYTNIIAQDPSLFTSTSNFNERN